MLRHALPRSWLVLGVVAALSTGAAPVRAFERQWHLGGGLGAAGPSGDTSLGPAVGIHGAYGLSDVFDLRLELQASQNEGVRPVWLYGARGGIAYKIDVIQWIPYAGISAGGFAVASDDATLFRPSVGALLGLDYAVSRHFGLGVAGAGDYVFVDSGLTIVTVLVRAEYRFGW